MRTSFYADRIVLFQVKIRKWIFLMGTVAAGVRYPYRYYAKQQNPENNVDTASEQCYIHNG